MTFLKLINEAENALKLKKLPKEVAFKILFYLSESIKNLNDFSILINDIPSNDFIKKYQNALKQYIDEDKPLAYIIHSSYFCGREFIVNDQVHSPRIETEILVDYLSQKFENYSLLSILDLCAGTGIIGLSLKANLNYLNVTLSDFSKKAIINIKENANKLNLKVEILESNLFQKIDKKFDVIVCNPPYIKENAILDASVIKYEPHLALFGGLDGLEFYRKILSEIKKYLNSKFLIAFEIGIGQSDQIKKIFNQYFDNRIEIIKDHQNIDRFFIIDNL